ncbi:Peptidase S12 aminopeptidase DmpB domain C [Penicillium argentinense]|uniref:Peptidase S12 aminopeptidase DmpB domain C n=1 Tax=Penicillium argentinense TaxID=1131581 RepID=A0A9W9K9S4_9EURO|nr:Peptidase S12 aminopeptidase DmpB domain C [Penicillium argentinense]KAJ5098220.1 Peptidase S12 aminopeptidase DmpB domain C [Penicillium argentinense]
MPATQRPIDEILNTVARRYRGPGGAIAVVKNGELVGQRVWGYADLDRRIPLTSETQMPICSITKQFVCALLLDLERNPPPAVAAKGDIQSQLTKKLHEFLRPELTEGTGLILQHLCDMQSGIRDYWAMTTLWGAKPDDEFLIERDCPPMVDRMRSFHFKPGMEYSYCNVNFYIVARVIEKVTGEPLGKLLAERVLQPAGMTTALLCPNTAKHPGPCVGYEGTEEHGYYEAVNRMEWSGDAGLVASLTDMVAYEKYLERLSSDPKSWYRTAIEPHTFSDGNTARYHYGLGHTNLHGVDTIGHGGALRGYRLHRRHAPNEHISVVALFNHEADASSAVDDVLRDILGLSKPETPQIEASSHWNGTFLDQETGLAIVVSKGLNMGEVRISYGFQPSAEVIKLTASNQGHFQSMTAVVEGDVLKIHRISDNRKLEARRITIRETISKDESFTGEYRCAEVGSTFHCSGGSGVLYGTFEGYLGNGPLTPMKYLGDDVWALTCPRGLDAPAPGDWTVSFYRDESGGVAGFRIGCWLARGLHFVKV